MDIRNIPTLFGLPEADTLTELEAGHINRTFLAVCGGEKYVLQSLNRSVFRAPEAVMGNINTIEKSFLQSGCTEIAVPHFIACGDKNYAVAEGELWRIYRYITATADAAADAAAAGRAFGMFLRVINVEKHDIKAPIEDFHDFNRYFTELSAKNCVDRDVLEELDGLRGILAQVFTDKLPKRVIHGDAKLDNIIIAERTTIIDLDTVMQGCAAIDYGDLVRSVCGKGELQLSEIRSLTNGFAQGLDGLLGADEVNSLYYGVLWLTGELAMRYFIDCSSEERYFRGKSPADCLARAEQLMGQLRSFRSCEKDLREMINSCMGQP